MAMAERRRRDLGSQELLLGMAAVATCVKLLLVPSYHSTDLEVHRHWLALTHSLPLKDWYFDETSPWTLDYPPFFAWFQRFLALFAQWVDPRMVDLVNGLNYASDTVVLFQRATVMVADGVLYWGLWRCCRKMPLNRQRLAYMMVVLSPGLIIVDHIHFQYNGFLLGILLISLSFLEDGNDFMGGVVFAVLLCFKHLFAVAAPVYFVYLFRHYCRGPYRIRRFVTLGVSVAVVVILAFGPFAYYGQMSQVLKRLFPFGRGLCHAYWAPNIWALYNTADKVISLLLQNLGFQIETELASMTSGLVGDFSRYAVLPQITPVTTLVLMILALVPCLTRIWKHPQQMEVTKWVSYAYMCGFMFGWHVHEKASLQFVIPYSLVAVTSPENASNYFLLSTASYFSLFPLLFETKEYPVKYILVLMHVLLLWVNFSMYFSSSTRGKPEGLKKDGIVSSSEVQQETSFFGLISENVGQGMVKHTLLCTWKLAYLFGMIGVEIYGVIIHPVLFKQKLPFLPLMFISVYCALGMLYSWIKEFVGLLFHN